MKAARIVLWIVLINLTAFLAFSAFAGGLGLLIGWNTPPVEDLRGSIFNDFTIPGIALFVLVGGSALWAAIWLIRRQKFALPVSSLAGLAIMFFVFVQVLVIGSPPGVGQALQMLYFGVGALISLVCAGIWLIDLASQPASGEARD
jgi:hypothetical protein